MAMCNALSPIKNNRADEFTMRPDAIRRKGNEFIRLHRAHRAYYTY